MSKFRGLTIWQLAARGLAALVSLQLFVAALIGYAYKKRKRKKSADTFRVIELEPIELEEGHVQLYMEGVSLFADMMDAIEQAKETILFETFIWKDDELGEAFRELFIKKAREGVEVYLIYDLLGNSVLGGSSIAFPTDLPTLHIKRFLPFKRPRHLFNPNRYNVTHRKALIVDNRIGFMGGYNLGEDYRTLWRDTHLRIEGVGALRLAYAFVDLWNQYRSRQLPQLAYPAQAWSSLFDVYRNDPLRRIYPIRSMYLRAIERAQDHIYITNAYFVPDPLFRQALIHAAERGVDVQVVLPWESNHAVVDWVGRHYFEEYLAAGIKLFGYEAAMIHTKTMTIDRTWSLIGTANLDKLSLGINHEINAEIFDEELALQMEAIFACDKEQSRHITSEFWLNRSIRMRLGEWILSPLWPLV